MRVRLQDIANEAGLSVGSVSLILRGQRTDEYTSTTVERVRKVAQRLGYQPNTAARSIQRGHFGGIGWIQSSRRFHSSVPDSLAAGVHDAAFKACVHVVVARLPDKELMEGGYLPVILRESMADGLLISYTHEIPPPVLTAIKCAGVPVVWLNVDMKEDCVRPDDFGAGRMATELLLKQGHRAIAYVNLQHNEAEALGHGGHYSQRHRLEGYLAAMRSANLAPRTVFSGAGYSLESGYPPVETGWLTSPAAPTAVVSYCSYGLSTCLRLAPELSVVTFSDEGVWLDDVHVDTFLIPEFKIGQVSIEWLLGKVKGERCSGEPIVVPFVLERGMTVRKPRGVAAAGSAGPDVASAAIRGTKARGRVG